MSRCALELTSPRERIRFSRRGHALKRSRLRPRPEREGVPLRQGRFRWNVCFKVRDSGRGQSGAVMPTSRFRLRVEDPMTATDFLALSPLLVIAGASVVVLLAAAFRRRHGLVAG